MYDKCVGSPCKGNVHPCVNDIVRFSCLSSKVVKASFQISQYTRITNVKDPPVNELTSINIFMCYIAMKGNSITMIRLSYIYDSTTTVPGA